LAFRIKRRRILTEEKEVLKNNSSKAEAQETALKLIREGKASINLKLIVVGGKLPLDLRDLIDLLFILKDDSNSQVRESVIEAARKLPEDKLIQYMDNNILKPEMLDFLSRVSLGRDAVLQRIVLDSSTLDSTIEYLAAYAHEDLLKIIVSDTIRMRRHSTIVTAILNNKNASQTVKEALLKEKEESTKTDTEPKEEIEKNLLTRIANLSVGQRVMLAIKGNWQERVILLRDNNKQVASSVLKSPKLNDKEVELISKMRNVPEEVLREIADAKKWASKYLIIRNLVENPKTPISHSMSYVSRLSTMDLRRLKNNRDVPEPVRRLGKQILDKRTAPSKAQFSKH
jgi:hypothetical protein